MMSTSESSQEVESRGFLDRMNEYFSKGEPKVGYGDNVMPIEPVQYTASGFDYPIDRMNYDYYYDLPQTTNGLQINRHQNLLLSNHLNRLRQNFGGYLGGYCYEDVVSLPIVIGLFAGLIIMFWVLHSKIWSNGGRRKRSLFSFLEGDLSTHIHNFVYNGNHSY